MNKFLAGTALAVVALSATPAAAQAVQGFRIEALGGFDIARQKINGVASPRVKLDDTGILYGLGAGYDFPITNGVSLGIDVELTNSTAKIEKSFLDGGLTVDDNNTTVNIADNPLTPLVNEAFIATSDDTIADVRYQVRPRLDGYVGGRLSFAVSDTSNFYIKGGYTRLRIKNGTRFSDHDTGAELDIDSLDLADFDPSGFADNDFDSSRTVGGYRVGAGAQVAFGTNTYVGAEVRYSNYSDDISRFQGALSLGYRFGARPVEVIEAAPPAPALLPEPAPATQTCPDGSVILATDICPAPPAPPMPEPMPERG